MSAPWDLAGDRTQVDPPVRHGGCLPRDEQGDGTLSRKTLDELEGTTWGPPDYDSGLVRTCHRLRTKPINEFTADDLRVMIGQSIGLEHLVPIALQILEEDPLVQGRYFPGDLLSSVVRATSYLAANQVLLPRLVKLVERAHSMVQLTDPQNTVHIAVLMKALGQVAHEPLAPRNTRPTSPADFEARIYFLRTDEGGRRLPVFSGYEVSHVFGQGHDVYQGRHWYQAEGWIPLGQMIDASVWLVSPHLLREGLHSSSEFTVQEGRTIVGRGQILQILNRELAGTTPELASR